MARTMRNFRLDDDVYAAAQKRARREYTNVTALIERYLAEYGGLIRTGVAGEDLKPGDMVPGPKVTMGYSKADSEYDPETASPSERRAEMRRIVRSYSKEQQAGRGKR